MKRSPTLGRVAGLGLLAALPTAHAQSILFVRSSAPVGGDGQSWSSPFNDLNDALDYARAHPDPDGFEIRLFQGVYKPDRGTGNKYASFDVPSNTTIKGGYLGDAFHDPAAFASVLSGDLMDDDGPDFTNLTDNSFVILRYTDAAATNITLDGLVFTGAGFQPDSFEDFPGSCAVLPHGSTARNCDFTPRRAHGIAGQGVIDISGCRFMDSQLGGAISFRRQNTDPMDLTVSSCTFERNEHALDSYRARNLSFTDCTFENNGPGTVLPFDAFPYPSFDPPLPTATLTRCAFQGNTGQLISTYRFLNVTIDACTITGNTTPEGALLVLHAMPETLSILDTTFSDNTTATASDPLLDIDVASTGQASISGCDFARNTPGIGVDCADALTLDTCDFSSGVSLFVTAAEVHATDCTFHDNAAGAVITPALTSTFLRCTFQRNGGYHGAVASAGDFTDCTFEDNHATSAGAAIGGSLVTLRHCTFRNNSTTREGGAIAAASVDARDCLFEHNHADRQGGAIATYNRSYINTLTIIDSTLIDNTAGQSGGGAFAGNACTIIASVFRNNQADIAGALAIGPNLDAKPTTIVDSYFAGNAARTGGAIQFAIRHADFSLHNSLVYANTTTDGTGGIDLSPAESDHDSYSFTANNSILWANTGTAATVEEQQVWNGPSTATPRDHYDHCVIQGWSGRPQGTDTTATDPFFVDPVGPDTIPGTPDDDLRLAADSPLIDAGSNALLPPDTFDLDGDGDTSEPIPFDLLGAPRRLDTPETPDTGDGDPPIVDLGPYEYAGDCAGLPDCNGNGIRDDCEFLSGDATDCNGNRVLDACDIASRFSDDCNADGFPDECQTFHQYAIDDLLETALPTFVFVPDAGFDLAFLVLGQYTVAPGAEVINAVESYAGSVEETEVMVIVYDDPNNDGDPHDAVPIAAAVPSQPQATRATIRTTLLPPTLVGQPGDSFFVGVYFRIYGSEFNLVVESACNIDREFIALSSIDSLDDALALADDRFIAASELSTITPILCSVAPGEPGSPYSILIRPKRLAFIDCNDNMIPDSCEAVPPPDDSADAVPDDCQCVADLDGNGRTDVFDFARIAPSFGMTTGATLVNGDLDADHDVDMRDVTTFMEHFGVVCRPPITTRGVAAPDQRVPLRRGP